MELVNEAYISTCQRTYIDKIIVGSQFSSHLISNATLHHGMSKVVSERLSYEFGSWLHKIPVPLGQVGKIFLDLVLHIKQQYERIAIPQGKEGRVSSNTPQ